MIRYSEILQDHLRIFRALSSMESKVAEVGINVVNCLKNGGVVFTCGNGGSASDAQHLSGELIGRFKKTREPLKSTCLNADTSVLTCIANDFGYDFIFERQLRALVSTKDFCIFFTTSGNSKNIIKSVEFCIEENIPFCVFTGQSGGKIAELTQNILSVPSSVTARIQEAHIFFVHVLCEIVDEAFS